MEKGRSGRKKKHEKGKGMKEESGRIRTNSYKESQKSD
jgi:hypothetical protein